MHRGNFETKAKRSELARSKQALSTLPKSVDRR
jgi:hypothetical protein